MSSAYSGEETPPFISEGHNTARRSWVKTYPLCLSGWPTRPLFSQDCLVDAGGGAVYSERPPVKELS